MPTPAALALRRELEWGLEMCTYRIGRIAIVALAFAAPALCAHAATENVLWSFKSPGLGAPDGRLLLRKITGALYGTTSGCCVGDGQVFRLRQSGGVWNFKTLLKFSGANGVDPEAGLIQDSTGVLYGTTYSGGTYGYGTVFKLAS